MNLIFINAGVGAIVGILFVLVFNVAKCIKLLTEIRDRLPPRGDSPSQSLNDAR